MFVLYVASKEEDFPEFSRFLSCLVQLKSILFNLLCVFHLSSELLQSALFQIFCCFAVVCPLLLFPSCWVQWNRGVGRTLVCDWRHYGQTNRVWANYDINWAVVTTSEGKLGMFDVSPLSGISGLSFDSTLLSSLVFLCLVLLLFVSYIFLPAGPFFCTFFPENSSLFLVEIGFFVWLPFGN